MSGMGGMGGAYNSQGPSPLRAGAGAYGPGMRTSYDDSHVNYNYNGAGARMGPGPNTGADWRV